MKDKNAHKKFTSLEDIKETGFSTPINFFNSFEDSLHSKITEEKLPSNNGFTIPNNYFESLENNITSKVNFEIDKRKVISFKSSFLRVTPYAAAASILLFIGLSYFVKVNNTVTFEDLSTNEIENWLDSDFYTSEVTDALLETDFNDAEYTNNINDTEIEDYLNHIDTSTLINEI